MGEDALRYAPSLVFSIHPKNIPFSSPERHAQYMVRVSRADSQAAMMTL